MAKNSGDLASQAKNSGARMRSSAMALMEKGWADMPSKTNARKRTEPGPMAQANASQKNMQNGSPSAQPTPYKSGGKVAKHDDAAADKKLFNKMFAAAEKKEPKGMKSGGKWIQGAVKKPGALHRELGVPQGKKIPKSKLDAAANSSNPTLAKRANFAKTVSKFAKGGAVPRGKMAKMAAGGMTSPTPVAPKGGVAPTSLPTRPGPVVETQRVANRPPTTAPQRTGFAPGQGPMSETNSPDPAANARAAALNASRSVAPPAAGRTPVPVGRSVPPAPVAPMPATRAPTMPTTDPRAMASGIQSATAAAGIPSSGGAIAGVPPRPYAKGGQPVQKFAMGGVGKLRHGVMNKAGKPIAQPKRGSSAWK